MRERRPFADVSSIREVLGVTLQASLCLAHLWKRRDFYRSFRPLNQPLSSCLTLRALVSDLIYSIAWPHRLDEYYGHSHLTPGTGDERRR